MFRFRRGRVHLVTQAPKPKSQDIGYRERRYLVMMGVRVLCFLVAIVMVTKGAGWWAAIPAAGAVIIPYFAVVFANGGREPNDTRGFQEYQPNLPERRPPAGQQPGGPDSPAGRQDDRAHPRQAPVTAGQTVPPGISGYGDIPGRQEAMQPPAAGDPARLNHAGKAAG